VKRGLVVLDPAEVADQEWRARVEGVANSVAANGVDVALVYGDVSRSDDIAYLTNLCVYWNEGVLAVPAQGEPTFLTKLSPRVHPWMRKVSTVTEIRSGRSFADLVTAYLADRTPGTLGLVDAGLWPASVIDQITAALPDWRTKRLGGIVRDRRLVPSDAELALLRQGGRVLADGLTETDIGAVERTLRGQGFLDVFVHRTTTTDGVTSTRVTGQYRTGWVQAARLTGATPDWATALTGSLAKAIAAARAGATGRRLAAAADATVTWVNQADLATGGDYAGHDEDAPLRAGAVVVIAVDVLFGDGGYAAVADTVLIGEDGAEILTGGGQGDAHSVQ
jgi:Xaa-Pro aminopeptidase